jgi:FixJ family two-component response regulator
LVVALATVYVVDDDPAVRRALERLLGSTGHRVVSFGTASEFLAGHDPNCSGCLVLDLALPGCGGLDLQSLLNKSDAGRPIIFLSGCGSISVSVQAMRAGAVTFLTKPVRERELVAAVHEAVALDGRWRRTRAERIALQTRMASLTKREREVLDQIMEGRLNKQIAARLGTVEQTVKVHRARLMKKMGARSLAQLVRIAVGTDVTDFGKHRRGHAPVAAVAPRHGVPALE